MDPSCKTLEELRRFVSGPLDTEAQEQEMLGHLVQCPECRAHALALFNEVPDYRPERRQGDRRREDRRQTSVPGQFVERRVAARRQYERRLPIDL